MGAKRRKKQGIKQKAVLSKSLERTAQNRVIFGADTKKKNPETRMATGFFDGGAGGDVYKRQIPKCPLPVGTSEGKFLR